MRMPNKLILCILFSLKFSSAIALGGGQVDRVAPNTAASLAYKDRNSQIPLGVMVCSASPCSQVYNEGNPINGCATGSFYIKTISIKDFFNKHLP